MRLILLTLSLLLSSCSKDLTFFSQTEKSEIKLCFLGNTGTGSDGEKKMVKKLETEKCDSIHFLGDLTYPHGIKSSEDKDLKDKFLDLYLPLTLMDNKPKLHLLMGNHDYQGSVTAWSELAQKERGIFFPHTFYLLKNRNLCMVHLDTNLLRLFFEWGEALEQIFWLSSLQDDLEYCKIKIALTHYPYKNNGPVKGFLESYVIGHFDYLISGHDHSFLDEGVVDNTRLLISGGDAGYLMMNTNLKSGAVTYEFK